MNRFHSPEACFVVELRRPRAHIEKLTHAAVATASTWIARGESGLDEPHRVLDVRAVADHLACISSDDGALVVPLGLGRDRLHEPRLVLLRSLVRLTLAGVEAAVLGVLALLRRSRLR